MNTHTRASFVPDDLSYMQRRAFLRACAAETLARKLGQRPEDILSRNWRNDGMAASVLRAATSSTRSSDVPWAATSVVLPQLAPAAAATRLLGLAVEINMDGVTTISVPFIGKSGRPPSVPFVGEGKPVPVANLGVAGVTLGPTRKLAIASALTRELKEASGDTAEAIIGAALATSAEQSLDAHLFSAAAATDDAPAGLLAGVAGIPSAGGSGIQGIADDLALIAGAIAGNGINPDDMVIVTTPSLATKLRVLASPKFDNAVMSSPSLPDGRVIGIVPRGLVTGYDGAISIETSRIGTLHMEDAVPADIFDGAGVAAYPTESMFQIDGLALKVRGWCAWAVHPGAVAYVTGAAW